MDELMNENSYYLQHSAASHGEYMQHATSHPHHGQQLHPTQIHPSLYDFHFNYASHPYDEFMNDHEYHDECISNKTPDMSSSFDTLIDAVQPTNTDYECDDDDEEDLEHADDEYLDLTLPQQTLHENANENGNGIGNGIGSNAGKSRASKEEEVDEHLEAETEPEPESQGQGQQAQRRKNLIIWDWDDTIFPTYSFRTHQDEKDAQFMAKLELLVRYIEKVFEGMIAMYGASNIIIVTNASETWINKCLNVDLVQELFLHFQHNILRKHQIACISASTHEITSKHPKNHHKWKEVTFAEFFEQYFDAPSSCSSLPHDDGDEDDDEDTINCITSIGDSICEYDASHNASKWVKNRILNRIRLKSNPSITEMINQLKDIASMMDQFGTCCDDMDIDYTSFNASMSLSFSDTTC